MKTTIDIPDDLYQQIAAASAATGRSVELFILGVVAQSTFEVESQPHNGAEVDPPSHFPKDPESWWTQIPKAPSDEVREVQRIIDEEFSQIDPRDWE